MCCLLILALNLGLITITIHVPVPPPIPPPQHYEAPTVEHPVYVNPFQPDMKRI